MEAELVLGCALAAAGAAFALVAGDGLGTPVSPRLLSVRAFRRLSRAMRALGATGAVGRLVGTAAGGRVAGEVSRTALARLLGLDARASAALGAFLLGLAAALSGVALASPVAGAAAGACMVAAILARDAAHERRRRRDLMAEMPGIYRTLSVAMGSGQTLAQAVEYVGSRGTGAASGAFARMSLRLRCGASTEEAVSLLAGELRAPGVGMLATALVISHRTGSPLRELLLRSARLVERQGEFERLLAVRTAQVRLSIKIVCLLPVVMIALLALISPDFQQGLLTVSGLSCVTLAMVLDGVALLIVRRIVRGVL